MIERYRTTSAAEAAGVVVDRMAATGMMCCASASYRNRKPGDVFNICIDDDGNEAPIRLLRRISVEEFESWIGETVDPAWASERHFWEFVTD